MVYLVKKTIEGHVYLYLAESGRVNGKVKRVWQKYLGPEEHAADINFTSATPKWRITTVDFGLPVTLMQLIEKLNLIQFIDRATEKRPQGLSVGQYIAIATLNRCIKPVSKNQIANWFKTTYLQKFFPPIATELSSMAYSNHFEYLDEAKIANIQQEINQKLKSVFHVAMNELVYDPTNFFTYMNPDEEDALPKHGHSKESRSTLNIVGLALLCTQDGGIPLLYNTYAGNVQDAAQFKTEFPKIVNGLGAIKQDVKEVILSFDKGNSSPPIFTQIDASGLKFIASIRPSMVKDLAKIPATQFRMATLPNGKSIGLLEYAREFYGQTRRLIVTYNPDQAKWNGACLTKKLTEEVTEVLAYFQTRLNVKKWRTIDAVKKKIESLIPSTSHWEFLKLNLYEQDGKVLLNLEINQPKLTNHIETLGKSYLISNHPTKTLEQICWLFRQQITVEKAFSYLKSPDILRARPIFHQNNSSIQGHLFTCALGLLLLTLLTQAFRKALSTWSLESILENLASIKLSLIHVEGHKDPVRQLNEMSEDADALAQLFSLPAAI